jgi:hypothetical protein
MMAPNSHHLIQISIVEEYRIFRKINLDKNDDFALAFSCNIQDVTNIQEEPLQLLCKVINLNRQRF